MMTIRNILFALVSLITAGTAVAAEFPHSVPAVQGYDVVSYQVNKRPVRGTGHFIATYDGAVYLFSTLENRDTFNANPEKYVPAYNGYCAFGVARGKKFIADPEVYRVVDGRLYLNLDASIQDLWFKDVPGEIAQAEEQWPEIKDKDPASL